jgi:hypothetical protein
MPSGEGWLAQIDRITDDLQSLLLDFATEPDEDWDGWVEMAMNETWDRLRKVVPDV